MCLARKAKDRELFQIVKRVVKFYSSWIPDLKLGVKELICL